MADFSVPPKILIVDDDPANIDLLAAILEEDGEILFATSGNAALAMAESERPDIVLLDVVMPDLDGYEVCRRLKDNPATAQIPVVFITALDQETDEEAGLAAGAVDYVAKPISAPITRARVRTHMELKRHRDHLAELAYLDGLTGVANRRRFDEYAELEWRRARRHGRPVSVLMVDVDQFKHFNDHYGHQAGDACLQKVAAVLGGLVNRPADLLARYGGEEFVCVLPETPAEGARVLAERMRAAVEGLGIAHDGAGAAGCVTISIGVATAVVDASSTLEDTLARADAQLYRAKSAGRNRVSAV
ncbi:PleD family two-component system response regulator [Thalassobaculum sp.]|uniref:PleD family two-component system response regulator n=1 Tax=Thalassobaculum sp. TaxID=2022740 RepID=UPI0032EC04BD